MSFVPVPLMSEINEKIAGSNGLKVVSAFAGCGGSSTGYKMAGCDVKVAIEFVDKAAETYRLNAPHTEVVEADIRTITAEHVLNLAGVDVGELDILDGSPPCVSFSTNGRREKAWGKEISYSGRYKQKADDLFFEYIRLIEGIKPKVFVAENVSGLVSGVALGYFKEIYERFVECGYKVAARKVEASRLGVPQRRSRLIFIGVRNDIDADPVHPRPLPESETISLADAIEHAPAPTAAEIKWETGERTKMAWYYSDVMVEGGCFTHAYRRLGWGENNRFNWFRLPPHRPCPTVTGKVPCLMHWNEPRFLTIPELKRVCSFPDDFVFPGKFRHVWERMGRSVPPKMMKEIASTIATEIFKR